MLKLLPFVSFLLLLSPSCVSLQTSTITKTWRRSSILSIPSTSGLHASSKDDINALSAEQVVAEIEEKNEFSQPKLSIQDEILQKALNIQPETSEEKSIREEKQLAIKMKQAQTKTRNIVIALLSFFSAIANYVYQFTHPITDVQLLYAMSQSSVPLTEIGNNGKPTVVDFWAPWCENCKRSAPTLAAIEKEYGDSVNFVMVNGDEAKNWPLIERFRVDAIPHLALVSKEGFVETALIGPIPRSVLRADLDFLIDEVEDHSGDDQSKVLAKPALPYTMFDAFQSQENMRKVSFRSNVNY